VNEGQLMVLEAINHGSNHQQVETDDALFVFFPLKSTI
jgi:hypothetical protein